MLPYKRVMRIYGINKTVFGYEQKKDDNNRIILYYIVLYEYCLKGYND